MKRGESDSRKTQKRFHPCSQSSSLLRASDRRASRRLRKGLLISYRALQIIDDDWNRNSFSQQTHFRRRGKKVNNSLSTSVQLGLITALIISPSGAASGEDERHQLGCNCRSHGVVQVQSAQNLCLSIWAIERGQASLDTLLLTELWSIMMTFLIISPCLFTNVLEKTCKRPQWPLSLSLFLADTGRVVKCASNQLVGAERVTAVEGQLSGGSLSYCSTAVVTNCY